MQPQERERHRPRARELPRRRQRHVEQSCGGAPQPLVFRAAQHGAQRPKSAPVAVRRAGLLRPVPLVRHEVPEPCRPLVEGVPEERQIASGQIDDRRVLDLAQLLEQHHDDEGSRVVIGRVPLIVVRRDVDRVLEDPRTVGQALHVP